MTTQKKPPFFGEFGDSISFNDPSECQPEAPQIAWRPVSIDFRQTKEQGERFFLNLYLNWLFKKTPFAFDLPIQITHAGGQCEPDFAVCENGRRYGLEIARSTTERDERALDELIKAGPGYYLEINAEDRNYDPKTEILPVGSPFYGEPLLGADLELKWARCTANRILKKEKKLQTNYSKFLPSCDLVLYSAASMHDSLAAIKLLQSQYGLLRAAAPTKPQFIRIAIVRENWAIFNPLTKSPEIFTSAGSVFL